MIMALLFDEDYAALDEQGLAFSEDAGARFFVFSNIGLSEGLYTTGSCNVLVMIPPNYNQAGNDMFWTLPRLVRADGQPIPQTCELGGGDNRRFNGQEYCRWSRHWDPSQPGVWRAGRDNIISIYRRIRTALDNPTPTP